METSDILTILIIVIGFFGQTMYFKGAFAARLDNLEEELDETKKAVRYSDTCSAMHEGLNTRVSALERRRNGTTG